jgi:hypothetical protein
MVSPVEFVFVCAGLWLLGCSCFGGVSPVQLVLVFVVVVDGFWFRFVSVRPVLSLFWIVCYLYQWSSYIYNRQSQIITVRGRSSLLTFHLKSMLFSNIADIMINIEIIIKIADRGEKRPSRRSG